MPNPNGLRTVFYISIPLFLLLPLSAVLLILERITQSLLRAQTTTDWRIGGLQIPLRLSNSSTTEITLDINYGPTWAIIEVAVITFIVGVLGACGIWELRRVEGRASQQRAWTWILLVANALVVANSVGVLGWASAVQANEKGHESAEILVKGRHKFTRETIVCEIAPLYWDDSWSPPACGVAVGPTRPLPQAHAYDV